MVVLCSNAAARDNRSANKSQSSVSGSSQNVRTPRPPVVTVVPKLNKVTAFEFTQAWGSLKGTPEVEPYVKILDQIQPKDLSKGQLANLCVY